MSGVEITTRGLPLYFYLFASISPNVLETDKRPGNTRWGPSMTWSLIWPVFSS